MILFAPSPCPIRLSPREIITNCRIPLSWSNFLTSSSLSTRPKRCSVPFSPLTWMGDYSSQFWLLYLQMYLLRNRTGSSMIVLGSFRMLPSLLSHVYRLFVHMQNASLTCQICLPPYGTNWHWTCCFSYRLYFKLNEFTSILAKGCFVWVTIEADTLQSLVIGTNFEHEEMDLLVAIWA